MLGGVHGCVCGRACYHRPQSSSPVVVTTTEGAAAQSRARTPIACRQMRPRPSPSADKTLTDWSRLKAVAFHLLPPGQIGQEGTPSASPASWPLLLTKEQLSAYLALSWSTISKICTVAPVDVGASVIRYNRLQIDEWVASLPPKTIKHAAPAAPSLSDLETKSDERRASALDKVRARTLLRHSQSHRRSNDGARDGQG